MFQPYDIMVYITIIIVIVFAITRMMMIFSSFYISNNSGIFNFIIIQKGTFCAQ